MMKVKRKIEMKQYSKTKVIFTYVMGMILLIFVFHLSFTALENYLLGSSAVMKNYEFSKLLSDIDRLQKDAEISQLGYLLINKKKYLAPYDRVQNTIWDKVQTLKTEVPHQSTQIEGYEQALKKKMDYIQESVNKRDEGFVEPLQILFTGIGRETSQDLEEKYSLLLEKVKDDLENSYQTAKAAADQTRTILVEGTAIAMLLFSLAMWGIFRDIKHRQKYEEDLIEAQAQALKMSEFKSQFLTMMSHEIRTPLNSIIGTAELLEDTPLTEQQKSFTGTFRRAGDVLLKIINDILDLSKIESGQMELELMPCRLQDLLDDVGNIMAPRAIKKNIELKILNSFSPNTIIQVDGNRLQQVFINLVGNAIKFTEAGSVTIEVTQTKPGTIQFDIVDTGIGIPQDKLEHIFLPFQQAEASTSRKYGGTGLGLSISKKIIELMRGEIIVESQIQRGSVFRLIIPTLFSQSIMVSRSQENSIDLSVYAGKRILIVDDVKDNRDLISHFLQPFSLHLVMQDNGLQAVKIFEVEKFDLIFMDAQMPVMDGFDAVEKIRKIERDRGDARTPIIALTAQAYKEERETFLNAGCDYYLSKPFKKAQLFALVAQAFQNKKGQGSSLAS